MKEIQKRMIAVLLCVVLVAGLLPTTAAATAAKSGMENFKKSTSTNIYYNDIPSESWYFDDVQKACTLDFMRGYSKQRFAPDADITIAEALAIAARIHSIYYTGSALFSQGTPWYQVYVNYANETGICTERFDDYGRAATRAEFVRILAKALPESEFSSLGMVADGAIPDVLKADVDAKAIYLLYRAGVLTGTDSAGSFAPKASIRRCEVAAIVTRMALPELRKAVYLGVQTANRGKNTGTHEPPQDPSPTPEPGTPSEPEVTSQLTDPCETLDFVYAFSDASVFLIDTGNVANVGDNARIKCPSMEADYIDYRFNAQIRTVTLTSYYHGGTTDQQGYKPYIFAVSSDGSTWTTLPQDSITTERQDLTAPIDWYRYTYSLTSVPFGATYLRVQWPEGYTVGYATELGNVDVTVLSETGEFVRRAPAEPDTLRSEIEEYRQLLTNITEGDDVGDIIRGSKQEFENYLDAAQNIYEREKGKESPDARVILIEQSRLKNAYERMLSNVHRAADTAKMLMPSIVQARALLEMAEEGTAPGQYRSGAKEELKNAISDAEAIAAGPEITESAACNAVNMLRTAMARFGASKVSPQTSQSVFHSFVTRSGDQLMDGEQVLRFASVNIPNTWGMERPSWKNADKLRRPAAYEQEDLLKTVQLLGGQVARTYTFPIQGGSSTKSETSVYLLGQDGTLSNDEFLVIDQMLALANEYGIRLIIPFIDNWEHHGGIKQFAQIFGGETEADFYANESVTAAFKQYIFQILNHVNSITGVAYKDDMAILAWETGNELNAPSGWTAEIAAYIKSIDANHLVLDGKYGVSDDALTDANIDIVSNHYYNPATPTDIAERVQRDIWKTRGRKAFVVGEYGTQYAQSVMDTVANEQIAGSLIWCLYGHSVDGGYCGDTDLHYPGKSESQNALMEHLRETAYAVQGIEREQIPAITLQPPELLATQTQFEIVWRGSAGAPDYRMERSMEQDKRLTIIDQFKEGDGAAYHPAQDKTAAANTTYYYRVIAVNGAVESAASNIITLTPLESVDTRALKKTVAEARTLAEQENEEEYASGAFRVLLRAARIAENIYSSKGAAPTQAQIDAAEKHLQTAIETFSESKIGSPTTLLYDNMTSFGTDAAAYIQMENMKLETSYSGRPGNNTANPLVMRTSADAEGYLLYYSDTAVTQIRVDGFIQTNCNDPSKLELWVSSDNMYFSRLTVSYSEGTYNGGWYPITYTASAPAETHYVKVLLKAASISYNIELDGVRLYASQNSAGTLYTDDFAMDSNGNNLIPASFFNLVQKPQSYEHAAFDHYLAFSGSPYAGYVTYCMDDLQKDGILTELTVYYAYHYDVRNSADNTTAKIEVSSDGEAWKALSSSNTLLQEVKNGNNPTARFGIVEQRILQLPENVRYVRITLNPVTKSWHERLLNVDLRIS